MLIIAEFSFTFFSEGTNLFLIFSWELCWQKWVGLFCNDGVMRRVFLIFHPVFSLEFQRDEAKKKLLKINIYLNLPFRLIFSIFFSFKIRNHSINLSYFPSFFFATTKAKSSILNTGISFFITCPESKWRKIHLKWNFLFLLIALCWTFDGNAKRGMEFNNEWPNC